MLLPLAVDHIHDAVHSAEDRPQDQGAGYNGQLTNGVKADVGTLGILQKLVEIIVDVGTHHAPPVPVSVNGSSYSPNMVGKLSS